MKWKYDSNESCFQIENPIYFNKHLRWGHIELPLMISWEILRLPKETYLKIFIEAELIKNGEI